MKQQTKRRHILVSYDISDDGARTQVFQICQGYGNHVQYSVFLCELDQKELILMREEVRPHINQATDQVMFVDFGPAVHSALDNIEVLGKPYSPPQRVFVV